MWSPGEDKNQDSVKLEELRKQIELLGGASLKTTQATWEELIRIMEHGIVRK